MACDIQAWILSKDVVLAVQYKVYLVKQVISLVDTVQFSKGQLLTYDSKDPPPEVIIITLFFEPFPKFHPNTVTKL